MSPAVMLLLVIALDYHVPANHPFFFSDHPADRPFYERPRVSMEEDQETNRRFQEVLRGLKEEKQ